METARADGEGKEYESFAILNASSAAVGTVSWFLGGAAGVEAFGKGARILEILARKSETSEARAATVGVLLSLLVLSVLADDDDMLMTRRR